ncbi:MAG: hypothetical protein ACRDPX_02970, partial [Gaiellaceae bacterium]
GRMNDAIETYAGTLDVKIKTAYHDSATERIATRRALVDAMREDVAPDVAPISEWPSLEPT